MRGDRLVDQGVQLKRARFLTSGDESGTAPEDRPFRPDVEGLRAVAVLLVVLFHAGAPSLSGGYVGVDVFFVISGFVITGVLLRERASSGRTSILAFYGRRCRRIIPAATLVIIVTVFLSYFFLGTVGGSRAAIDGRWAAVFLANFRFIATGTSYLGSTLPPSPLQNYCRSRLKSNSTSSIRRSFWCWRAFARDCAPSETGDWPGGGDLYLTRLFDRRHPQLCRRRVLLAIRRERGSWRWARSSLLAHHGS